MMRTYVGTWALVGCLLASVSASAQEDFLAPGPLHEAGLEKYWQLQLPLEKGQSLNEFYLVDDALYAATDDGYVYALDAHTGVIRWLQPVSRSGYHVRRPCHAGNNVIFVTPVDIQKYDRLTGHGFSRTALRFPSGTAGVCDDSLLFIGGLDRRLYAFDLESIQVVWKVMGDAPITSTPAIFGESIFFATASGTTYACTRKDKMLEWKYETFGPIDANLVATSRGIFVASRDLSLYLLDHQFGRPFWQARFSGPLEEAPVVADELAFQYSSDDGLIAVETAVGVEERLRWKLPQGRQALTITDRHVFILNQDHQLLAVALDDGTVDHAVPTPGFGLGASDMVNQTIFMANARGKLFCARPEGLPPLKRSDLLHALRGAGEEQSTTAAGGQPTTRPARESADPLHTPRTGRPVGGKSQVTREFIEGQKDQ